MTVETMLVLDEPDDIRAFRFEAIVRRSLDLLLCLDVTGGPGRDPTACLGARLRGAASP